jgi:hypothetical protein
MYKFTNGEIMVNVYAIAFVIRDTPTASIAPGRCVHKLLGIRE